MVCLAGLGFWIWIATTWTKRINALTGMLVSCAFLLIIQGAVFSFASRQIFNQTMGLHSRNIANILTGSCNCDKYNENIYFYIPGLSTMQLQKGIEFWGVDIPPELLHSININDPPCLFQNLDRTLFFVSSGRYDGLLIGEYTIDDVNYYIYGIEPGRVPLSNLTIVNFNSVKSIIAGVPINAPPTGESAFWLVTTNATPTTVVVFLGQELKTTVISSDRLVAILPNRLIAEPKIVEIYLLDKFTGEKTRSIEIVIQGT